MSETRHDCNTLDGEQKCTLVLFLSLRPLVPNLMPSASQLRSSPDPVPLCQVTSQLDPLTSASLCQGGMGTDDVGLHAVDIPTLSRMPNLPQNGFLDASLIDIPIARKIRCHRHK